jgi:uncharacterized protein
MKTKTNNYNNHIVIRDPIHGFINISKTELDVINTSLFQRLRGIKQLAMAELVYPGANHSRFDHSIGVLHVAGKIANNLFTQDIITKEDVTIIRLAALLHDLGHGPYSHVSEYLLRRFSLQNLKEESVSTEEIHEKITKSLILNDISLNKLLGKEIIERVIGLFTNNDICKAIISGPIDSDKLDYLKRDAYFTGVKYGEYDLEKILESMIHTSDGNQHFLGIKEEGVYAIEQYILAKHHMNTQVYRHKIRSITDNMIVRGIECGIKMGDDILTKLYSFKDDISFGVNYCNWDDSSLKEYILNSGLEKSKEIFKNLKQRKLFKKIYSKSFSEIDNIFSKMKFSKPKTEFLKEKENEISDIDLLKCDNDYVIINVISITNPLYRQPYSDEDIFVVDNNNTPTMLSELQWSIMNLSAIRPKHQTLEVYAPCNEEYFLNKEKYLSEIKNKIENVLFN